MRLDAHDRGIVHISPADAERLRKLALSVQKGQRLGRARLTRSKTNPQFLVVDSGATRTLIKRRKWFKKLQARIKMAIYTATGQRTLTRGGGALGVKARLPDGSVVPLDSLGHGHWLPELSHSLLSVSQMCEHGCSVVFKPKEAYLVTPGGDKVLFDRHEGLYIIPVANRDERWLVGTNPTTPEPPPNNRTNIKRTLQMLQKHDYSLHTARYLRLNGHVALACTQVAYLERKLQNMTSYAMPATTRSQARGQRAGKGSRDSNTPPASEPPRPTPKPKSKTKKASKKSGSEHSSTVPQKRNTSSVRTNPYKSPAWAE